MAEIVWTEPALAELDAIGDYIALDDRDAACSLIRKIFLKVDLLEGNPQLGSIPEVLKKTPYRRLTVKPVCIYYRVEQQSVKIVYVERAGRNF